MIDDHNKNVCFFVSLNWIFFVIFSQKAKESMYLTLAPNRLENTWLLPSHQKRAPRRIHRQWSRPSGLLRRPSSYRACTNHLPMTCDRLTWTNQNVSLLHIKWMKDLGSLISEILFLSYFQLVRVVIWSREARPIWRTRRETMPMKRRRRPKSSRTWTQCVMVDWTRNEVFVIVCQHNPNHIQQSVRLVVGLCWFSANFFYTFFLSLLLHLFINFNKRIE